MSERDRSRSDPSRRRFLRRAARAGVGLAAAPIFAAPEAEGGALPRYIEVPAGTFSCGRAGGGWDQEPAHAVTISRPFRIAVRPVSNAQYELFDPAHRLRRGESATAAGDDDPVRFVHWGEANAYCCWLGRQDGRHYRLPTEAEWEYAFLTRAPDLEGGQDVENWCLDWYGPYPAGHQTDPIGYLDGEVRAVRGGSWRGPTPLPDAAMSVRLGALPDDRSPAIGLRVVEAPPVASAPLTRRRPTPCWAQEVSQEHWDWTPPVERTRPFFAEPVPYVKVPAGASGPLYSQHNHDPALVACSNGDLLAVWYTCRDEAGRELTVAASRLRHGSDAWDDADLFWDVPGRNDHAPALWADGSGALYHFNGQAAEGGWQELALILRISRDNGRTWTPARFLETRRRHGNQPIPSPFQGRDGALYLPCDAAPTGKGGSVLHVSRDGGKTWSLINDGAKAPVFADGRTGAWIAGIHAGVDQWTDGSFVAVGRGDTIGGSLAMSVSQDGGLSWTYSATPFPPLGGGQRPVLRMLREGALLLVSFTPGSDSATNGQGVGSGMFAALSYDGGKSWPVRRLLTDGKTRTLDGRGWTREFTMGGAHAEPAGYLAAIQAPDGMIHLISSGIHYRFNLAWLRQRDESGK